MNLHIYLLTTFCAITFIEAVPWEGAQPTSQGSSPDWNSVPTPTGLLGSNDLQRRQNNGNLCGYISGSTGKRHHTFALQSAVPSRTSLTCDMAIRQSNFLQWFNIPSLLTYLKHLCHRVL